MINSVLLLLAVTASLRACSACRHGSVAGSLLGAVGVERFSGLKDKLSGR